MFVGHWSEVNLDWWKSRWPDFHPSEIASKGNGSLLINEHALDILQSARNICGRPFYINSAYRDPIHNAQVGGAPRSAHKEGIAFDISLRGHNKDQLIAACGRAGFTGFGVNYNTFLHVDTGRARRW